MGFASSATGTACSLANLLPLPALAPGAQLFRRARRCCQQPHPAGSPPGPCSGPPALPHVPTGHTGTSAPQHWVLAKAAVTVRGPKEGVRGEGARGAWWGSQGAGGAPSLLCTHVRRAGVCTEGTRGVHTCVHRGAQREVPVLPEHAHLRRVRAGTSATGTACAAGATNSPRSSWRALVRAGGLGAAPSRSWCLSQERWPQAVTQGPGCLFFRLFPSLSGQSCWVLLRFPGWLLGTCLFPIRMGKFLEHRAGVMHHLGPCSAPRPHALAPASHPGTRAVPPGTAQCHGWGDAGQAAVKWG